MSRTLPDLTRVPFFLCLCRHRLFHLPAPPLGATLASFSPPRCPKRSKSDPKGYPLDPIFDHCGGTGGNVKTTFSCRRNLRFHGSRGSREPLVQHALAIETAIVAPIAYPTPKNEENVGPMAAQVAQGSPKGVPGGGSANALFRRFFASVPLGGPLGRPGSPKDPQGHQIDTKITPK